MKKQKKLVLKRTNIFYIVFIIFIISCTTNGDKVSYYKNGQKKSLEKNVKEELLMDSYWDIEGKLIIENGNGFDTIFYDKKRKKPEYTVGYLNGKKEGEWIGWNENGSLAFRVKFNEGLAQGEFFSNDKFGELEECGYYINGLKEGIWIDRRIKSERREGEYLLGKENGFWREYYDSSYWEGYYKNGLKVNKWILYSNNNQIKIEGNYIIVEDNDPVYGKYSSVKDGKWKFYSQDTIKVEIWDRGVLLQ